MKKTILVTGSTDGIGLATAKTLAQLGHNILLHGRSGAKLENAKEQLQAIEGNGNVETYQADLSVMADVRKLAAEIRQHHQQLDVLINNAGVYNVPSSVSRDGLDVRFVVNTIAPYMLMNDLKPLLGEQSRVVNLSSAAQAPVRAEELMNPSQLADGPVYAKSKLALTMWSLHTGLMTKESGPIIVAVNPASMLGSNMVKNAYGVAGGDLQRGADILVKAALSDEFASASGTYFDNDIAAFADPHRDALSAANNARIVEVLDKIVAQF
jgi:NAD(P)-dependent dehydrogenase (short-subunit alcohol dehydrogenase family)